MTDYASLTNEHLLNRLYVEEDRLPRAAADEFVKRDEAMPEPLSELASERLKWTRPDDQMRPGECSFLKAGADCRHE